MTAINYIKDKFKSVFILILFIMGFFALIYYRTTLFDSVYSSVSYSLSVLYPSLFPFIFLSTLFSMNRASLILSKLLSPFMRYVMKLPECMAPAFISALLFGYPLGAKLTSSLVKEGKITENEASRLFSCCLSPGIPFCVLFLGGTVFGDVKLGFYIFLSILISDLLLLFFTGLRIKVPSKSKLSFTETDFFLSVKLSLDSTVKSLLNMALYVVVFRCISALFFETGLINFISKHIYFIYPQAKAAIFCFLFEVTEGISKGLTLNLHSGFFAAGLSFGGLCMFFQLFSFFDKAPMKFFKLIIIRSIGAVGSFFTLKIFSSFTPSAISCFTNVYIPDIPEMKGSFLSVFALTLLFLFYILIKENKENDTKLWK